MRNTLFVLVSLIAVASVRAEVKLIPYPRSLEARAGVLALGSPVSITVRSPSAEDRFAAGLLVGKIWPSLRAPAKVAGFAWLAAGLL